MDWAKIKRIVKVTTKTGHIPKPVAEKLIGKYISLNAGDWGCRTEAVRKLVREVVKYITGEEPKLCSIKTVEGVAPTSDYPFPVWTMIVPLKKTNSHDYLLKKPTLLIQDDNGIKIDGDEGNHLPPGALKNWGRKATDAEIEQFFKIISKLDEGDFDSTCLEALEMIERW
jgi:hypothetical protein